MREFGASEGSLYYKVFVLGFLNKLLQSSCEVNIERTVQMQRKIAFRLQKLRARQDDIENLGLTHILKEIVENLTRITSFVDEEFAKYTKEEIKSQRITLKSEFSAF